MFRSFLPLGALAFAACHLVIGLDGFTKSAPSTDAGAGGGAGTAGTGGQADPGVVVWASTIENGNPNVVPSSGLGENFLVVAAGVPNGNPFAFRGINHTPPTQLAGPSTYAAVIANPGDESASFAKELWSPGPASAPVAVAVSTDGTIAYLAAVVTNASTFEVKLFRYGQGKLEEAAFPLLKSADPFSSEAFIRELHLALSPDGNALYVGLTHQGSLEYALGTVTPKTAVAENATDILILKYDTNQGAAPKFIWGITGNGSITTGTGEELAGLVATDSRVVLATHIDSEFAGFDLTMSVFSGKGTALVSIGTANGNPDYTKGEHTHLLQCSPSEQTGDVRPVALTRNAADQIVLAFASNCVVPSSPAVSPSFKHQVITPGTFGIASIGAAALKGDFVDYLAIDTGHDANYTGGRVSAIASLGSDRFLVVGEQRGGVREIIGTKPVTPDAVPGSPGARQGFAVVVKPKFEGLGAGFSTLGNGTASFNAISVYGKFIALGGIVETADVKLFEKPLQSDKPTPFVAVLRANLLPL